MIPPDYSIGDSHFVFNSFMYKKYCEAKGIELEDLLKQVKAMLDEGRGFKTADFPDILLAANKSYCLYNKQPFTAGEMEAYEWLDQMGGLVNGVSARIHVFKLFIARLLNIDPGALNAEVETSETQPQTPDQEKKSDLRGDGSTY
jgi:hypothetical protein